MIIWLLYKCCVGGEASRKGRERPLSPGFFGDKYSAFDGPDQRRSYDERSLYAGSDGGRPSAAALSQRRDSARSGLSRNMSTSSRAIPERQMSSRRGSGPQQTMSSVGPGVAGVGAGVYRRPTVPQPQAAATPPGFGKPVPTRRAAGRLSLGSEAGDQNFTAASNARGIEDGLNPSRMPASGAAAGAAAGGFARRIGTRRRSGGGLARVPSSGAATARSMPRLQPVETLARDSRHATRGGLRVMNEEPEDESVAGAQADAGQANGSPPVGGGGGGGAGGYRRASYDPHSLRPLSPEMAAATNNAPSVRTSLTQRALEARNQTDPEAQSIVSDRSSIRRWLGFGIPATDRPAPSRGPPSYRTHA